MNRDGPLKCGGQRALGYKGKELGKIFQTKEIASVKTWKKEKA